jgi:hypothetical protein
MFVAKPPKTSLTMMVARAQTVSVDGARLPRLFLSAPTPVRSYNKAASRMAKPKAERLFILTFHKFYELRV